MYPTSQPILIEAGKHVLQNILTDDFSFLLVHFSHRTQLNCNAFYTDEQKITKGTLLPTLDSGSTKYTNFQTNNFNS